MKYFPEQQEDLVSNVRILRLLDNLRSPPGAFQILETINKLNKTSDNLISDFIKHLKQTSLILFDKNIKSKITILHSFSEVNYFCEEFVEKNRGSINPVYKQLFEQQKLYFLEKHDYSFESVNKWYKSDEYRNRINSFFQEVKFEDCHYLICLEFHAKETSEMMKEIRMFSIESLISDNKKKFPFRLHFQDFCNTFLELVSHKIKDNEVEEGNYFQLTKTILNYLKLSNSNSEFVIGKSKIFLKNEVYSELINRVKDHQRTFKKYQRLLKNRLTLLRFFFIVKRVIKINKHKKEIGRQIIRKLVAEYYNKPRFQIIVKMVRKVERIVKTTKVRNMLEIVVKKIRRSKCYMLTAIMRFRFKKTKKAVIMIQRNWRNYSFFQRLKTLVHIRRIVLKVADRVCEFAQDKKVNQAKQKVARLIYRTYFFTKNKTIFEKFREYLKLKLRTNAALKIQTHYRGFRQRMFYTQMIRCVIFIQKNMKRFVWRRNYLKMKNGVIKIQRLWRCILSTRTDNGSKKNKGFEMNFYLERKERLSKINQKTLKRAAKKYQDNLKAKSFARPTSPIYFEYFIDLEVIEAIEELSLQNKVLDFLEKLADLQAKNDEEMIELKLCDSYFWALTDKQSSYCSNDFFMKSKTQNQEINKLDFYGGFPNHMESGKDCTYLYYDNYNELKFLGDFDFYGADEVIKKRNGSLTIRFDDDFHPKSLQSSQGVFVIQSHEGELITWPFHNSKKNHFSRITLKLKEKIDEVACGESFSVFKTVFGKVGVISQTNQYGELGNGGFENPKQLAFVKHFEETNTIIEF